MVHSLIIVESRFITFATRVHEYEYKNHTEIFHRLFKRKTNLNKTERQLLMSKAVFYRTNSRLSSFIAFLRKTLLFGMHIRR
jgi:hypothetical protein